MSIKDSMEFVLNRLEKLRDEERIRYEGVPVFEEARQELVTAIATYTEITTTPPAIIYQVMTSDQVAEMVDSANARASATERVIEARIGNAELLLTGAMGSVSEQTRGEIEASDAAMMAAVVASRDDVIAALTPPAA